MAITLDGTNGITTPAVTNNGAYTGDGISFADATPSNTLVTTTGGNVGIGASSPTPYNSGAKVLQVNSGVANSEFKLTNSTTGNSASVGLNLIQSGNDSYVWNGSNSFMAFGTNNLERMRITSAGDMSMGGAPASPPTQSNDIFSGGLYLNPTRRTTGNAGNTYWDSGGALFRSTSSLKYKTDVKDAPYGLDDVLKLRSVTYKGKSESDGDKVFGGFIAEEVHELGLSQFVVYDTEGNPDSLAYANMVSLLTKAIQEQQAIITDLKARIETLENK